MRHSKGATFPQPNSIPRELEAPRGEANSYSQLAIVSITQAGQTKRKRRRNGGEILMFSIISSHLFGQISDGKHRVAD
jgi:hypothetical protein